jgi:hypothetical protein
MTSNDALLAVAASLPWNGRATLATSGASARWPVTQ